MKILLLLLFPLFCNAQNSPSISKNDGLIYSAQFVAGMADGMHEVLVNHIHTFERVWPNAHMHWWNPKLSQDNKKHFPTIISDGYHTTRTIEHAMNYFSIGVAMGDKKKLPLILKKMLLSFVCNRIGFIIVYDGVFHVKK